jgi:hypothetical protein
MIVVERGVKVEDLDACASRVRVVLDAQGWTDMVEDHCPTVEKIVFEFYANLHRRCCDSFWTWVRSKKIEVTSTLISNVTGASWVCNPEYTWPVDHLPTRAEIVECFIEGHPHQMETKGESSFQLSDLSIDV